MSDYLFLDFESYYDKEVSIKTLGAYNYLRHPKQDIYLVSTPAWVGHPKDFDWSLAHGKLLIAHNAAFDKLVFERLQELGVIPSSILPEGWQCTANLAAYFGVPRDLKSAAKFLLGKTVDKSVRTAMSGKYVKDLTDDDYLELLNYGLQDSRLGNELWVRYSPKWPELEQLFSRHTIYMVHRGVQVDAAMLNCSIESLTEQSERTLELLPWVTEDKKKPLSKAALDTECRMAGVEPPKSMAMGNEETEAWLDKYAGELPFVMAVRNFRRINTIKTKLEAMRVRLRSDGRFPYELKYFGAATGRDSGAGGFNMQNLSNKDMFGIDVRGHIIPAEGKEFVICDLAQIEARVLLTLIKDYGQLDLIRSGVSPYEAHARASMGWEGGELKTEDPKRYKLAKARVLALGYGCGWKKFIFMAYQPQYLDKDAKEVFSAPVQTQDVLNFQDFLYKYEKDKVNIQKWNRRDEALEKEWVNSWLIVNDFRRSNPRIPKFWELLDRSIKACDGSDYSIRLPSGRELRYRDVRVQERQCSAIIVDTERFQRCKLYGGLLVENVVQATARDIFRDACLAIECAGYPVVMRVHDEVVCEVHKDLLPGAMKEIEELMASPVSWLPDCPVGAEAHTATKYKK